MSTYSKPTQAQIEAAARIVCAVLYRPAPDMSGDIWKAVGPGMKQRCVRAAEDILDTLTAAAEVGVTEAEQGRWRRRRQMGIKG